MKRIAYRTKDYLITFGILFVAGFFLIFSFVADANLLVKIILIAFILEPVYSLVDLLAWKFEYDENHFVTRSLFQKEIEVSYDEVISAGYAADTSNAAAMRQGKVNFVIFYRNRRICVSSGMKNVEDFANTLQAYRRENGHYIAMPEEYL